MQKLNVLIHIPLNYCVRRFYSLIIYCYDRFHIFSGYTQFNIDSVKQMNVKGIEKIYKVYPVCVQSCENITMQFWRNQIYC